MESGIMMLRDMPDGSIVRRSWEQNSTQKRYRLFRNLIVHTTDLEDVIDTIVPEAGHVYLVPMTHSTRLIMAEDDDEWVLVEYSE